MAIQSTVHAIYYNQFNCTKCLTEYSKRPDYKTKADEYDKLLEKKIGLKGCKTSDKVRAQVEDIKYYRCIGNFRSDQVTSMIDLYYHYKNGVMPFPGSLMEQPSKIIDVFNLIDACIKTKQAEIEADEKRKAKGKRHGRS